MIGIRKITIQDRTFVEGSKSREVSTGFSSLSCGRLDTKQRKDGMAFSQSKLTTDSVLKMASRIDSEKMEKSCRYITGINTVLGWKGTVLVTCAIGLASSNSGSGHSAAENCTPVISTCKGIDLGSSSKFGNGNNECFIEQATLLQVLD